MDVLSGREPLAEAAVASVEDQLTLFPLAGAAHRRSVAWNAELTGNLMRELATAFDLVVVDSGPLEGPGGWGFDSQELAAGIVAVVVRDVRITSSDQALGAARRLKQCGMRAVGIIENFAGSEGV